ncbi:MAG: hypothetical protein WD017_03245, partial [Cucumibacter sp.]
SLRCGPAGEAGRPPLSAMLVTKGQRYGAFASNAQMRVDFVFILTLAPRPLPLSPVPVNES